MQVKRFIAANMRQALKMVREEMGPDAVILSNKRVPEGVELLISLDAEMTEEVVPKTSASKNPFQQAMQSSESLYAAESLKAGKYKTEPSKLEQGLDSMQRQAKARARLLAQSLSKKSQAELEETIDLSEVSSSVLDESVLSADKVDIRSEQNNRGRSDSLESVSAANVAENTGASLLKPQSDERQSQHQSSAPFQGDSSHREWAGSDDELSQMRAELQSMHDLLERQFSAMAWGQFSQQNPQQASLWKRLKRMGIDAKVAKQLLGGQASSLQGTDKSTAKGQSANMWQSVMRDLNRRIAVPSNDLTLQGGVFAFVGPTGAGKTTTIGKLATRYVLAHGADDVALVTTDTMRIAAHEQLRTLGRILKVPVRVVDKNNSLEQVLHSLRHKSLVLIDTAGLNRHDARLKRQLETLNEFGNRIQSVLVMPTTSQAEVIKANYHSYKTDNLSACVLTKLDETACLGGALSLAIEKSLAIAYVTSGQGVPEDIDVAKGASLIHAAIELAKEVVTDDEVMADEFAVSSGTSTSPQSMLATGI